jgi:hypothetical protein
LLKLDGARGTTLRVTRGTLWLTQEHDTRDFVLTAGDVYTIDRGGLTLVEAQNRASVCVLTHQAGAIRSTGGNRPPGDRFREWVESIASASQDAARLSRRLTSMP